MSILYVNSFLNNVLGRIDWSEHSKIRSSIFIDINAMILFIYCSYELYKLIRNYVEIAREIFSSKQFMVSNAIS